MGYTVVSSSQIARFSNISAELYTNQFFNEVKDMSNGEMKEMVRGMLSDLSEYERKKISKEVSRMANHQEMKAEGIKPMSITFLSVNQLRKISEIIAKKDHPLTESQPVEVFGIFACLKFMDKIIRGIAKDEREEFEKALSQINDFLPNEQEPTQKI